MKDLHILREEIDEIDDQIMNLISKRFEITNEIGLVKADSFSPAIDKSREMQILSRLVERSKILALNPDLIRLIFQSILSEVVLNHNKLIQPGKNK